MKLKDKELRLLAAFVADLHKEAGTEYLELGALDMVYDSYTTSRITDVYSNLNQLDMFDENVHVRGVE